MGDLLMHALIACLAVLGPAPGPDEPLAPWATNRHPTDAPKRHVEAITAGRHAYIVRHGGTMDGADCRSPLGVGLLDGPAIEQPWESNRAVRRENVGRADRRVTPARVVGHCVSQGFFDGRWNLFDGDMHAMYLLRDNQTVAGEQDLVRDHDLIKRSHTQGILNPDKRVNDEWGACLYVYEGEPAGDRNSVTGTSMDMLLRPGEAITWRWGHPDPVKYHGSHQPRYPDLICNGLWEYRPDFARDLWRQGAAAVEGVRASGGALTPEAGKTGTVVWILRSPYVF